MRCACDPVTGIRCGAHGDWLGKHRAPAIIAQFTAVGREDERIYRTHNVTRRDVVPVLGGSVERRPLSPADGCRCGNCAAHLRRASITGAAEPGKDR